MDERASGHIKRKFHGTYNKISIKLMARFVLEYVGLHNLRPLDPKERMRQIANDLSGQRLRFKGLVA